jgi:tRNA pseudouridine13 synthase
VVENPIRKNKNFNKITSQPLDDKETRTKAHQAIRKVFNSRLDSTTGLDNSISISIASRGNRTWGEGRARGSGETKGKLGWQELGGEYLHFTLYKENKDTMEIVYFLASQLKLHTRNFQYAGTKDRRAVTVQRLSVYRTYASRLASIAPNLRNAKLGGFKHGKYPLKLGDLKGNEFVITLRDCHFPGEESLSHLEKYGLAERIVKDSIWSLGERGFINYYGLQRFGSFDIGTDEIGKKLLQENLQAAVEMILAYSPLALSAAKGESATTNISSDDRNRALAIRTWEDTGNANKALAIMPKKFSAESSIIRQLGRGKNNIQHVNDWQGALSAVQRGLRLMYVHAYQSLVWNTAASERWNTYGDQVVAGDLVIDVRGDAGGANDVDESGELIVRPASDDRAFGEESFVRARPLSKDEANNGKYLVWDVVLPLPGFDVVYPANDIGQFYVDFMKSDIGGGLDPHNMRRRWKDISLSGGYRKFMARPAALSGQVQSYASATEQLAETDLERLRGAEKKKKDPREDVEPAHDAPNKLAVILKMQLGSSQYATMALRELLKVGGLQAYKADFARD